MIVPLGGDVYVNAAHISLISAVQRVGKGQDDYALTLVLMGAHKHTRTGSKEELTSLHSRMKNALDQLGP